ncbi:hypothetical protein [Marmoricola sp. OAE513]|uniref:hypothetical protein n=1 Tax=Marmoricola sp. OAE513 TaxID=2817894 RepID=UPI001AEAF096
MRTKQYAFILVLQIVLLTATMAFGADIVRGLSADLKGVPSTVDTGQIPGHQEPRGLIDHLSR